METHISILPRRLSISDADWLQQLRDTLKRLLDARVDRVRQWLAANTERFGNHEDIKTVLHSVEHLYTEMEVAVQPCGASCASCHLSCLRPKNHPLQHDCETSHACSEQCDMVEEHVTPVLCGLPYVHSHNSLWWQLIIHTSTHSVRATVVGTCAFNFRLFCLMSWTS